MPPRLTLIRLRKRRRSQLRRFPALRTAWVGAALFSLTLAGVVLALTLFYANLTRNLPAPQTLLPLIETRTPTRVYDSTGTRLLFSLENPAATSARYLTLPEFPASLITVTLAVQDPNFWQHNGFLPPLTDSTPRTLAEQLSVNLLLWNEPPGVRRALRQKILAAQLTATYGREKILEWYLNSLNYGRLAYGADAAAQVYFAKSARDLNLAEAAMLAAAAQAPALNPLDSPEGARQNQRELLQHLQAQGILTAEQTQMALQTPLNLQTARALPTTSAAAFSQLVFEQIAATIPWQRLERGGLRIVTTLNADLQIQTTCAALAQLARLTGQTPPPRVDSVPCSADRLLPTLPQSNLNPSTLAANVILLNPQTGQILAYVQTQPFANIQQARPAGTLLTPFIYLTALTRGFSPASLVWDIPDANPTPSTDTATYDGPMRLRIALANDEIIPAQQLITQVGSLNVARTLRQAGLPVAETTSNSLTANQFWQNASVSVLQVAQAYGIFANEGVWVGVPQPNSAGNLPNLQAQSILRIEDTAGRVVWQPQAVERRPILSPQLAYLLNDMLSDESARWRTLGHPNPLEIGQPVAAKVGQTTMSRASWTVGYTPSLVAAVWLGDAGDSGDVLPPMGAAALWHAVIQHALRDQPPQIWARPPGIVTLEVCDPSGLLPTRICPNRVTEVFAPGSEPTRPDSLYRSVDINRETKRLATVFTPPELVQTRIYLVPPPEALNWAKSAGWDLPPEDYDLLFAPVSDPTVALTVPQMFATVRGVVTVQGSAAGDDFRSYRLQAGAGLNPQAWVQIGEESTQPVTEGVLAEWDTRGLSGLYALQLLVVRSDQRVARAVLQVTVDNEAPQVTLMEAVTSATVGQTLLFTAQASDNLGLAEVRFVLDGTPQAVLQSAPYVFTWQARLGKHTLRIEAVDFAGNRTVFETVFDVVR
ncbi:MAG: PBP1A family penicillin-binding protein [Anaerolineales bacterium]